MQSDARRQEFNPDIVIGNNDEINNDMISEIEKELTGNPYDMISLVFLLYDVPDTALQRLIVFQRVSKDMGNSANLLHEWFRHAKHTPTWKHEFIEALLLCQLNSVVRKLGFQVPATKKHYHIDNIVTKMYINPVKKALYKLCESINADNLLTLKKSLLSYDIDVSEYDSCELIFLRLMCDKFITIDQFQYNRKTFGFQVQLDKLLRIIDALPGLQKIGQDIKNLQHTLNEETKPSAPIAVSTPNKDIKQDKPKEGEPNSPLFNVDFEDTFNMIAELSLEDNDIKPLKADRTRSLDKDSFEIKNTKRLGVCVILNQDEFYPSKNSIENAAQCSPLSKRVGSTKDKALIEKTMTALNFAVYSKDNLDHKNMIKYLIEVLKNKVTESDSVFMLCILSHGVKGHIYAADSVKVNVDVFQKLLDSEHAKNLYGKPKLMIIQACQIEETPHARLVADNPLNSYPLKKTNFLIYWATAPELEAYRDEDKGSMFIQILCRFIREYANKEHMTDIYTKVNNYVTMICKGLGKDQVPLYQSTLLKKLYLKVPE